tara:strand:+ start:290 stop:445 length:156 start_codon:yes stop_codon:yes gene_type:complete
LDISDRKAAKRIVKVYKKHPEYYTQEEVLYAKMIKKLTKKKKDGQSEGQTE